MSSPPPPPLPSDGSSYTGDWEYDVFLCFRGDDTRHGFTSHLRAALLKKQTRTFIDDMLKKTESIDALIPILGRCAISVVVFSDKFADSPWCLDEVATVARRMVEFGHRVLPVFYKVDPSDVTDDSGTYAATINRKFEGGCISEDDKKRWIAALKDVANCAGHTSHAIKMESELIEAIVEDVLKQLIDMSPGIEYDNLVGIGSRILEVEKLLAMEKLDDTRIIGLWGMGGVGKTALAKACYQRITCSTEGIKHHFVGNINGNFEKWHGGEGIVRELYSELLSENNIGGSDLDASYRRGRLSRLRVFIVLDDVETPSQLEQLLLGDVVMNPAKLFAQGSRIIVTTRNKRVLEYAEAMVYKVVGLNHDESIRLFSLRAFRQRPPSDTWKELSHLATSYCKGNPLALRVLGGTLFGLDIHYWRSFLSELRVIEDPEIHDILRRSYNKLGAAEKSIFLDVACFHCGISRSQLVKYMAALHPAAYVKVKDLIDRSLLTNLVFNNEREEIIEVHDLLKEMAWTIVNEEPKLGKRSRLVDFDDIHKLLTTQEVKHWTTYIFNPFKVLEMVLPSRKKRRVVDMNWKGYSPLEEHRTTEGISLDLYEAKEMYLEANAFEGMSSLTYLKIYRGGPPVFIRKKTFHLPCGGLNSLPDGLRWLEWEEYPSKSLPLNFFPQHLVHLIIRRSPIQKCWQGNDQPQLVNLMVLDLSGCGNLIAIPDLSKCLKLEELKLCWCESLVEVPSHVQYLTKLIRLDTGYCENLERLPSKLDSKLLTHVLMNHCLKVMRCPEINSDELMELNLAGTPVRELPSAVYSVKKGGTLRLCGQHITNTNFPAISASLSVFEVRDTAIREMDVYDHHHRISSKLELSRCENLLLYGNSKLERLPKSIWNMVSTKLHIDGSPLIESLPEISKSVEGLTVLTIIDCGGIKSVPSSISNLKSLLSLTLTNSGIKSLPSSIQELDLYSLDLEYNESLVSLPSNLQKLSRLSMLTLCGCKSIRFLPELPPALTELDVSGCKSLQALPSRCAEGRWQKLRFHDCPQLEQSFSDTIVTNFLLQPDTSAQLSLQCWRSELPREFAYKSVKDNMEEDCCTVKVEFPPFVDQVTSHRIAFGVVCSGDVSNRWVIVSCDGLIGDTMVTFRGYETCDFRGGDSSSDNLCLWSERNLGFLGRQIGEEWYAKWAGRTVSFHFRESEKKKQDKIKSCGVYLVYGKR